MKLEHQYLNIMKDIIENGTDQQDRTSVGSSRQVFFRTLELDTKGKYFPVLQCRTTGTKMVFNELMWMLSGNTDATWLQERGVHIWDGNTTREFLDSRGLYYLPVGSVGKSYGYQFRNSGGKVDQLYNVINGLLTNPTSRRHIINLYIPEDLNNAPLEPCSFLYEFMYDNGVLHLHQHARSQDFLFGTPANLVFGGYLQRFIADAVGLKTGKYILSGTNVHIYANQHEVINKMLLGEEGKWYNIPELCINNNLLSKSATEAIDKILNLEYNDISFCNYTRGFDYGTVPMAK